MMRLIRTAVFCAAAALAGSAAAQDTPGDLLARAQSIYLGPDAPRENLVDVRSLLAQIVAQDPTSDMALEVLRGGRIGTLDVGLINQRLLSEKPPDIPLPNFFPAPKDQAAQQPEPQEKPLSDLSSDDVFTSISPGPKIDKMPPKPAPVPAPLPDTATQESEDALELDRQAIRDLQARLLVMGFDPNGIDGAIGRGTRTALGQWQSSIGAKPTGFLNAAQLAKLKVQSETALALWRKDPQNERQYQPPPPIALGPRNMSGNWRFTVNCGADSKVGRAKLTGVLNVKHSSGGQYSGTLRQSQGLGGRFSGQLSGRRLSGEVNYGFPFGRIQINGTIEDQRLVMRGRDSNRCSFYAAK